ncbi:MAG: hypothetical protein QM811_18495 [Pirellulales bacterium]
MLLESTILLADTLPWSTAGLDDVLRRVGTPTKLKTVTAVNVVEAIPDSGSAILVCDPGSKGWSLESLLDRCAQAHKSLDIVAVAEPKNCDELQRLYRAGARGLEARRTERISGRAGPQIRRATTRSRSTARRRKQ